MRKNPYLGLYVVLEGIECCGKGTQRDLLKQYFDKLGLKEGVDYNFFVEPTPQCDFYKLIRNILGGKIKTSTLILQEYMAVNRNSFEENFLFDSLNNVPLTIVDRSYYSNFAYYMADGGDFGDIVDLNKNRIIPDCTIFLNISARESMRRLAKRKGKSREIFEQKLKFAEKLRQIYLDLLEGAACSINNDVRILNGKRRQEIIMQKIIRIIRRKAEKKSIFLIPKGEGTQKKRKYLF